MKNKDKARSCAAKKTSIGGQALMEGIMMRGPHKTAMAVRNPDGQIVLERVETGAKKRPAFCKWPFIRGLFGYVDAMSLGYKCLMRSAEIAGLEDVVEESAAKKKKREAREAQARAEQATEENAQEPTVTDAAVTGETSAPTEDAATDAEAVADGAETVAEAKKEKEKKEEKLPAWVMSVLTVGSMVLGIVLAVGLFLLLPTNLFELLEKAIPNLEKMAENSETVALYSLYKSAFEGIIRIVLLVGYMAAISLMKDIRRTFMFHGAEHKSIFCYEAGLELTVENVRLQRRFHPRCGTSFLILMLLVSIFISFPIDLISYWISEEILPTVWRYVVKILLIPLIVGAGFELIKLAGRHDNWFTRVISAPGVWLQHLTVLEPTDDMIECAIAAIKEVIPEDGSDRW